MPTKCLQRRAPTIITTSLKSPLHQSPQGAVVSKDKDYIKPSKLEDHNGNFLAHKYDNLIKESLSNFLFLLS